MDNQDQGKKGKSFWRRMMDFYEEKAAPVVKILVALVAVAGWAVAVVSCNIAAKQRDLAKAANDIANKQTELAKNANELVKAANDNASKQTELLKEQTDIAKRAELAKTKAETLLSQREKEIGQLRDDIKKREQDRATAIAFLDQYKYLLGRVQQKFAVYKDVQKTQRHGEALAELKIAVSDFDKFVAQWRELIVAWDAALDGDEKGLPGAVVNEQVEVIAASLKSLQDKAKHFGEVLPELIAGIPGGS
jgi:hypothetical protein